MKRTKPDKQFMIQFDQSNRNFLVTIFIFLISFSISLISLLVAVLAIIIAIDGITLYSISIAIIFGVIIVLIAIIFSIKAKKVLRDSKKMNKQAQDNLFEIYPEYKDKYH